MGKCNFIQKINEFFQSNESKIKIICIIISGMIFALIFQDVSSRDGQNSHYQILCLALTMAYLVYSIVESDAREHRYQKLFDHTNTSSFEMNSKFRIKHSNDIFKNMFYQDNGRDLFGETPIINDLEKKGSASGVHSIDSKKGKFDANINVITTKNNPKVYTASITDELDENRIKDMEFQRAKMETLGCVTASLSHEMNNMLQILTCKLKLIKEDSAGDLTISQQKNIEDSFSNLEKTKKSVKSILEFSKQKSDVMEYASFKHIIQEVEGVCISVIRGNGITFDYSSVNEKDIVMSDKNQLFIAMQNLVFNSIDSMKENKTKDKKIIFSSKEVKFQTRIELQHTSIPCGKYTRISIEDSGCGIKKEFEKSIFNPYFSTKDNGTGIGLSMVKGIVENNKGYIDFSTSTSGTTFNIFFRSLPDFGKIDNTSKSKLNINAKRVLVVDDSKESNSIMKAYLSVLGINCIATDNPIEAMEYIKDDRFDLVITDLQMPVIDGFELIRRIRDLIPDMPILVVSAMCETQNLRSLITMKGIDFLQKPINRKQLTNKIQRL